jgi:hypothetical protein
VRNVSDKLAEKIKTNILYLVTFLRNRADCEWKNVVERDRQTRDGNIIRRMRFAGWINKATDRQTDRQTQTHTETQNI